MLARCAKMEEINEELFPHKCMPRCGIAESKGLAYIYLQQILPKKKKNSQSDCINLHSHQEGMSCFTSLPALGTVDLFHLSHPGMAIPL